MVEIIQNVINWLQPKDELDNIRDIIDDFAGGKDISAEDVTYVMLYSVLDDPYNYKQNESIPQIIEDPNNPIILYLKDSGCSEEFMREASRLRELVDTQEIMSMVYNNFKDGLKSYRDIPIDTTFYENMRWSNINLEKIGWCEEFKANRYN